MTQKCLTTPLTIHHFDIKQPQNIYYFITIFTSNNNNKTSLLFLRGGGQLAFFFGESFN